MLLTARRRARPRHGGLALVGLAVLLIGLWAAPGAAQDDPTPTPQPAEPTPTPDSGGGGGNSTQEDVREWLTVGLLAVAVIAVIAVGVAIASRASQTRRYERVGLDARIAHSLANGRWVHDQVSLDVLGTTIDPAQLAIRWQDARRRIMDASGEAATLAVDVADEQLQVELRNLAHAFGALSGALDTNVGLRNQPGVEDEPGRVAALAESTETVQRRRIELQAAIDRVAAIR